MNQTGIFTQPSWGSPSTLASRGLEAVSGGLIRFDDAGYLIAQTPATRTVGLVSGGGAGHEPLHAGFLGDGGLDAACPGEVFTSPHNRQIFAASVATAKSGGVLHIVKNYTGDVLNFRIAAERLRGDGIDVGTVIVDDDLGSDGAEVGRRGTAATVIVEKILGAAADSGAALDDLVQLGSAVNERTRSVAVAVEAHRSVDSGDRAFAVTSGKYEFGVGIHGERGEREVDAAEAQDVVKAMIEQLIASLEPERPVLVLVNGLGGTSNLELLNLGHIVTRTLAEHPIALESIVMGTYVAALDMRGFSLTVCDADPAWLPHWYAEHKTLSLPSPRPYRPFAASDEASTIERSQPESAPSPRLDALLVLASEMRAPLNALDRLSGDGDFGENFHKGVSLAASTFRLTSNTTVTEDVRTLADAFLDGVGGSSGPLLGILLDHVADALSGATSARAAEAAIDGLHRGCEAVMRVGGAKPGDRTMIDAVAGCLEPDGVRLDGSAVRASLDGAWATVDMLPRRGRASYVGDRALGAPDPGAVAVSALIAVIAEWVGSSVEEQSWRQIEELLLSGAVDR